MSAHIAFSAPVGSLIAWSDGTPRPPERHSKKLASWKTRNGTGRMIRKEEARTLGSYTAPASFTLHEGNLGGRGTFIVTILRTFGIDSTLVFTVVERPPDRFDPRVRSSRSFTRTGSPCREPGSG
jgi:hypothetical protein|nr:hypothetical protein RP007_04657 [Rhizobium sp. P007]